MLIFHCQIQHAARMAARCAPLYVHISSYTSHLHERMVHKREYRSDSILDVRARPKRIVTIGIVGIRIESELPPGRRADPSHPRRHRHPPWPHGHAMPTASSAGRSGCRSHSRSQNCLSVPGNAGVQPGEQCTSRRAHDGPGELAASGRGPSRSRQVGLVPCGWLALGVIASQHVRQQGILSIFG